MHFPIKTDQECQAYTEKYIRLRTYIVSSWLDFVKSRHLLIVSVIKFPFIYLWLCQKMSAYTTRVYPVFCGIERIGVLLLPPYPSVLTLAPDLSFEYDCFCSLLITALHSYIHTRRLCYTNWALIARVDIKMSGTHERPLKHSLGLLILTTVCVLAQLKFPPADLLI